MERSHLTWFNCDDLLCNRQMLDLHLKTSLFCLRSVCVLYSVGAFLLSLIFPAAFVSFCHLHSHCFLSNVLGRIPLSSDIFDEISWKSCHCIKLMCHLLRCSAKKHKRCISHIDATCHSKQMNQQTWAVKSSGREEEEEWEKYEKRTKKTNKQL